MNERYKYRDRSIFLSVRLSGDCGIIAFRRGFNMLMRFRMVFRGKEESGLWPKVKANLRMGDSLTAVGDLSAIGETVSGPSEAWQWGEDQ